MRIQTRHKVGQRGAKRPLTRCLAALGVTALMAPGAAHADSATFLGGNAAFLWLLLALLLGAAGLALWLFGQLRRTRRALAESENRYSGVVDNMPLGVVLLDTQFRVLSMNRTMREWFPQVDPTEKPFCYKAFEVGESHDDAWFCPSRRTLADGRVHRAVVELPLGGEDRLLRIVATPLRGPAGEISSVVEIFDDISEYKRSQVALEEQLQLMQSLLETAPLPTHYKDREGRYLGCNKAYEEFLGLPREEIIGRTVLDFFPKNWAATCVALDREIVERNRRTSYEERLPMLTGEQRDVIISKAAYLDAKGDPAGVVTVILDISQRKRMEEDLHRAEEKYRSIFENAVLGIFRTTLDGRFEEASPSLAAMLGYADPAEMLHEVREAGAQIYADSERRREILADLQQREGLARYEAVFRRKDGSTFYGSINVRLQRDAEGRPLFLEGIIEDITERREAEEQMRRARAEAEQANCMKSDFIAAVTHELRTPLTSVLGFGKILRKKLESGVFPAIAKDNSRARRSVQQVRDSLEMLLVDAEILSKLINDIIDLSKLESGELALMIRPEPSEPILRQAVAEVREIFARAELPLRLELPEFLPHVLCDRELVGDVLRQLLDNALKFTMEGGGLQRRCPGRFPAGQRAGHGQGHPPGAAGRDLRDLPPAGRFPDRKAQGHGLGADHLSPHHPAPRRRIDRAEYPR